MNNFHKPPPKMKTVWKKAGPEEWCRFNEKIKKQDKKEQIKTYKQLQDSIINAMNSTIGKKRIRINKKKKAGPRTKAAKKDRKKARKEFEKAIKEKHDNITQKLEAYKLCQANVRQVSGEEEKERLEAIFQQILDEGGTKSQTFWKARRRILKANQVPQYNIITEDGETIEDPTMAKEHIANYYEKLYQAREASMENKEQTKNMERKVNEWANDEEHNAEQPEITIDELNRTIKKLKRNKSCGPDNIPNEALLEADNNTREIIRRIFNNILQEQNIPDEWQIGTITRLYKGKGQIGRCSNERGITCASNMGKAMERIVDKRARKDVTISDAQAGGKEKRATTDHLLILKETIKTQNRKKKPTYLAFLDVTKAYDKAWSDGIMYAMHENGLKGPLWNTVRKFNMGLKAQIKTKDGLTRQIQIKDSIRQGGVLSVLQYATVMDEIAKELEKEEKGIAINNENTKIGCLLWMDDVVILANDEKELQDMINTTKRIADKYHIVFGKEKSKTMITSKKESENKIQMGEMILEWTDKYKYLGEIMNKNKKIKDQIEEAKRKSEGALQTIFIIAGDPTMKNIEMEVIWNLVEVCIIPIITYGSETWEMNKTEKNEANRILDNILKRLLMVPTSTPREVLYHETNMLDVEHNVILKRINMHYRLEETKNKMLTDILNIPDEATWAKKTEDLEMLMNLEYIIHANPKQAKEAIKGAVSNKMKGNIMKGAENKSKVEFLINNCTHTVPQRKLYMEKMTRHEVSTIFKARTRMLDIKNNFRGKYTDIKCRACGREEENQDHIMEHCSSIHKDDNTKIPKDEIFTENINTLEKTVKKINWIMNKLNSAVQIIAQPGDLGVCTSN
jgi:hypothetical protein